jgi:protein phosphatase
MLGGELGKKEQSQEGQVSENLIPAAITDAGCERELNEDRYAVIESPSGLAWLVCDGMGGVSGGELAAQLALDAIRRDLENMPVRSPEEALKSAILEANRIIVLRRQNPAFAQMGTTVVASLFSGPEMVVTHAGDSRAYLVRDGAIQQLTTDHTLVQDMVDRGKIRAEEALAHPDAHILTRCIGSEPGLAVQQKRFWIWPGDKSDGSDFLMLCTDGLYSQVSDGEMANLISQNPPQQACVKLVELAKERGGYDNITLAIIPLGGQLQQEPPPGYDSERETRKRIEKQTRKPIGPGLARELMIIGVLCLIAFFLTVLVMAVVMSR